MTNGEKLKEIFPYLESDDTDLVKVINIEYLKSWWNAEYKEPTTKNDLGVDCISRAEAIKCLECDFDITGKENMKTVVNYINSAHDKIVNLPSVTPQLSSELEKNSKKLEKNFGELDCISRKAILDELEKWDWQELYLPIHFKENIVDVLPSVTPQEPILDKIRAEIEKLQKMCDKNDLNLMAQHHAFGMALDVIDKYKAESEGKE